jgi:hypothetical protein
LTDFELASSFLSLLTARIISTCHHTRWKYYVLIHENGTIRPFETVPRMRRDGIKENDGGSEFKYTVRTLVSVTMFLYYNNKTKIKKDIPF